MAPKRRGAFVSAGMIGDPKFSVLAEHGRIGMLAQTLLPHYLAACDDQGRAPADTRWVRLKAGVGIPALTPALIPKVVALYGEALCQDGPWAIVYEAQIDGRAGQFIQWIDWHQHNTGLRYKEPSKYPPPPGWTGDDVKSWEDDPHSKGSRAYKARRGMAPDTGTEEPPFRNGSVTEETRNRNSPVHAVQCSSSCSSSAVAEGRAVAVPTPKDTTVVHATRSGKTEHVASIAARVVQGIAPPAAGANGNGVFQGERNAAPRHTAAPRPSAGSAFRIADPSDPEWSLRAPPSSAAA